MDVPPSQIINPANFQELFSGWDRFPDADLFAGGTNLPGSRENNIHNLPPVFICLDQLDELHHITRTEHYLEIGSMVKLNRLVNLGKTVPKVLRTCIENIAWFQVRNISTIGGNICSNPLRDIPAPLTALEAQYELRNANTTRWVSAFRFHSTDEMTTLNNQEILTRIRLPLHHWNYEVYKKFHTQDRQNTQALVFMAKTQKNILSEIRIICKTCAIFRNKSAEDILNGKLLPLSQKTTDEFVQNWKKFLIYKQELSEFSRNYLFNGILENIYKLSE